MSRFRFLTLIALLASLLQAQGTIEDYRRAWGLREKYQPLAINVPDEARWIEGTTRFFYRKSVQGGHEYVAVDAPTQAKSAAFDQTKLAAALSKTLNRAVEPLALPLVNPAIVDKGATLEFLAGEDRYRANLADYTIQLAPNGRGAASRAWPPPVPLVRGASERPIPSPDGKLEAVVQNYNLHLREKGKRATVALTYDGSEDNYYAPNAVVWAPDSSKIAAYRVRPGYIRKVHFIQSSPEDQLQPKLSSIDYNKPGDVLDLQQPVLIEVASRKLHPVANTLFPNPYNLTRPVWRKNSSAFTFEYNQRGHEVYRVIEVDAATGAARAPISEEPKTFFNYSGKRFRHDVNDGREIVWMSERDGWNHLYLMDGATGKVKNQITRGPWVVRGVEKVDDEKRQVWFRASGMYPGKDPYFVHYYRINMDGSGLITLTEADANHAVTFSPDMKYFVDTYSRVDLPTVSELREVGTAKPLARLETSDTAQLEAAGWRPPEVFTAMARDGKTDIWGVIYRPTSFDPAQKYPVVENIYAGPHSSFVPKSFSAYNPMQSLAELGFIVVQIDGMGTSNRSKAFHDVAWKNLKDAGFPDRVLWHKSVAAKYPWYDISRVGIYGHSAGGQNAMGALLFHGDFYKAAVSSCGCHDNRMDKIWWNEQWMGWPIGPHYSECSNVDNAHRLAGKLLLSVGEMDNNVDPSSTLQVVNALIKAGKTFDFIMLPGQAHSNGGPYGDRLRYDFFVKHLLGRTPPEWNALEEKLPAAPRRQ
ncbi:MAG TPA: S9 family peptidase [Solibacterales bacterium]|nr:S9 family peptidase [Bryobacterales bacterium]